MKDFIAQLAALDPERFDMAIHAARKGSWLDEPVDLRNDPRTAGCIAGWYCAFYAPQAHPEVAEHVAARGLGLMPDVADQLFMARDRDRNKYPTLRDIPLQAAITTLEHLDKTGEVLWL